MFTTTQEALKKTIEAQLTELKSLISHVPHVAIPTPVQSIVLDPRGHRHRFISITLISICRWDAQEGVQEGAAQLDLSALPSETLQTPQTQIAQEFNNKEQCLQAENVELKQDIDQVQMKYRKATVLVVQKKQEEVSLKKVVAKLCSKLLDMQLELEASILDNVQKVVVCTQALAIRMDTIKAKYKSKIAKLEKRDPSDQLKVDAKEINGKIEQ